MKYIVAAAALAAIARAQDASESDPLVTVTVGTSAVFTETQWTASIPVITDVFPPIDTATETDTVSLPVITDTFPPVESDTSAESSTAITTISGPVDETSAGDTTITSIPGISSSTPGNSTVTFETTLSDTTLTVTSTEGVTSGTGEPAPPTETPDAAGQLAPMGALAMVAIALAL